MEHKSFYILANGAKYSEYAPTFISDSNSATFRFTSDESVAQNGALMLYQLSECLYLKNLNQFVPGYHLLLLPIESEP